MFDEPTDLSPDLDWMLHSDQVDDETLIEALVRPHYQTLYDNALSWLLYPEDAHRAVQETFIHAILQAKNYRLEAKIDNWLDSILSGIINQDRNYLDNDRLLNYKLFNSVWNRHPLEALTPRQIELAIHVIKSEVQSQRAAKTKLYAFQVLGLISTVIFAAYLIVDISSAWFPGPPGEGSQPPIPPSIIETITIAISPQAEDTRLPIKDFQDKSKPLVPLTLASDQEEIWDRILSSNELWETLWVSVVLNFYGPSGYIGPPYSERHQLWINRSSGGLHVSGPLHGVANEISKRSFSQINPTFTNYGNIFPWFYLSDTRSNFPFTINFFGFDTFSLSSPPELTYSPVAESVWAGRDAIITEINTEDGRLLATLWLDSLTGTILREQYYDPNSTSNVIIESHVTDVEFNKSMPTLWNSPTQPTPIPRDASSIYADQLQPSDSSPSYPDPLEIDLSQSQLAFFKPVGVDYKTKDLGVFHLYADSNLIGEVEIVDPLRMICARSPDGSYIVFSELSLFSNDINDRIYLIDLSSLNTVSLSIPDLRIGAISISPKYHQVIVSGYDVQDRLNRLYLVDFESRDLRLLPIPPDFGVIAWSPDGNQLAIMEEGWGGFNSYPKSSSKFYIYDVESGKRFTMRKGEIPPGLTTLTIPLDGWTATSNLLLQDLSNCTFPG